MSLDYTNKESKIILAIETSCDETAAAVVKDGRYVLSSVIQTQIEKHIEFGGVIPELAARFHLDAIDQVVRKALSDAQITLESIDAIAVTRGPGLVGALLIGISYAKVLALSLNKPLLSVNHIHAHIHGAFLSSFNNTKNSEERVSFPCLALVVSGGHTNLYRMQHASHYELLGSSLDDACGECFDKVAKILKLDYPGGPKIEQLAKKHTASKSRLTYPMPKIMQNASFNFSYSGLKTHMNVLLQNNSNIFDSAEHVAAVCYSFQEAAFEQICTRIRRGIKVFPDTRSVVIAGGVSANLYLRERLIAMKLKIGAEISFLFPELKYCSDNAAMIAACAFTESFENKDSFNLKHFDSQSSTWDAVSNYFELV